MNNVYFDKIVTTMIDEIVSISSAIDRHKCDASETANPNIIARLTSYNPDPVQRAGK